MARALVILTMFAALASAIASVNVAAAEQERRLSDEQVAQVEERLAEARERLELTAEQEEAIKPILRNGAERSGEVFAEYGVTADTLGSKERRLSFREMRQLRGDMDEVRAETRASLAEVLSAEQMESWDELAEESRARMREQIKSRR